MIVKKLPQIILSFGLIGLFSVSSTAVLAVGKPDGIGRPTGMQVNSQDRMKEAKLKSCQARENSIKQRSTHIAQLASTMEEKFDAIATRVEEYYNSKVVPSGKTVADYDTLVATINSKKAAVTAAVTETQTSATSFTCDVANPKEQVMLFKDDMKTVQARLKEYRTSIKNLIVAVHSVTGETEKMSPSESPKPSKIKTQGKKE
ncbi:MAG: hypothetical protein ABIO02_03355 [Patescibacteria group bacterium]